MAEYKWIAESGECAEEKLTELLKKEASGKEAYIALFSDEFQSGKVADIRDIKNIHKLLEVRVFSEGSEFYACRTALGAKFGWRVTDDTKITEKDYIDRHHFIDINSEKFIGEKTENGNRRLMTTVGGTYSLPITDETRVRIRSYIFYDSEGMARVRDYRVCGFEK